MTTDPIFQAAQHLAQHRAYWLAQAADATRCEQQLQQFPRRRCLHLARECEARIVNLAIKAERLARGGA